MTGPADAALAGANAAAPARPTGAAPAGPTDAASPDPSDAVQAVSPDAAPATPIGHRPGPAAPSDTVTPDRWTAWRAATPARLALGRAGAALPTDETLRFGWAHAAARDAVHAEFAVEALDAALRADGWAVERVASRAPDRATFLRRPDLGRRLEAADRDRLHAVADTSGARRCDVCIVVGDGLSALAVERHAVPLLAALRARLPAATRWAPIVVAAQARVALADEVGEAFDATLSAMLIGERPGLSSPDSLGIYLTHGPRVGRHDAERNCISNVRPAGLAIDAAAFKLAWLMRAALRLGATGIALKDESDHDILAAAAAPASLAQQSGRPTCDDASSP